MPFGPRAIWRKLSAQVAEQVVQQLGPTYEEQRLRLGEMEAEMRSGASELAELKRIVAAQLEAFMEVSELHGRLVRTLANRVENLEEQVAKGK